MVVQHMRALPHREVAAAIRTTRESTEPPAVRLAFEFPVLTAARWGEVRWAVWTVSVTRMKAKREHRVPLCRRALEILEEAQALVADRGSPLVFTLGGGKPLHDQRLRRLLRQHGIAAVPHGFRSSFRDWAADAR